MKVLLFHPRLLPPVDYGGTERVVLWLAKGLKERGHDVTIASLAGSRMPPGVDFLPCEREGISAVEILRRIPKGMEIVHFMAPPEEGAWKELNCGGIVTIHGNGKKGEVFSRNSVFISKNHAQRHGSEVYVYNGVDPDEYLFGGSAQKEKWYLFLAKTSWSVKNLRGAMRYCAKAGVELRISGGSRPLLRRVEAWLRPGMEWVGPVAGTRKAELLARARGLVFPVLWHEPFGLAVVEALISGTPVLASPFGSLPELVPPDVGAILSNEEEWIRALSAPAMRWEPERCRQWALEKFHYLKMAEGYELLYQRVAAGGVLNPRNPVASSDAKVEEMG